MLTNHHLIVIMLLKDFWRKIMSRLKKKNMVVHSNCFATAIDKKLTSVEQRMIAIYLSKLNPNDQSSRQVFFPLDEYEALMGLQRFNITQLKQCAHKILSTPVIIDNEDGGFLGMSLFTRFELKRIREEWIVLINCSEEILPFLFDLKREFLKYELWNVLNLTETNHQQMYRLLKQYEKIGHRTIELEELKFRLGVSKKYAQFKDFKKNVLEKCKKALKEYTDIYFEYETIRKGRKIHTVSFQIHKNENQTNQLLLSDYVSDKIKNMNNTLPLQSSDAEMVEFEYRNDDLDFLSSACDQEFSRDQMQLLFDLVAQKEIPHTSKYELDMARYHYLKEKYDEMKMRNPNKSRFGYLKTIILFDINLKK